MTIYLPESATTNSIFVVKIEKIFVVLDPQIYSITDSKNKRTFTGLTSVVVERQTNNISSSYELRIINFFFDRTWH